MVEQLADVRRGDVADDLATEQGIDLVLRGAFEPVVAAAFDGRELEHAEPVSHALFERFFGFVALDDLLLERGDVIRHLLVDLCLGGAGEALALALTVLVHVPHHARPATVGADERVAVGEQLPLCHAGFLLLRYSAQQYHRGEKIAIRKTESYQFVINSSGAG